MEDREAPIEVLADLDGDLRVSAAQRAGEEMDMVRSDGDRVVVADDAAVLEAEDRLRLTPDGP